MDITLWTGIPVIVITICSGLLLLGLCAVYIAVYQNCNATYIWVGLMAGFQILISFTSSKVCGIVIGGKEFFIIAGSFIYPILACGEDYINEFYGKEVARNSVIAQLIARVSTTLYLFVILYLPAPNGEENNYNSFFELMNVVPRIAISSLIATYIGGMINVEVFAHIKLISNNRLLWFRSFVSTITGLFINSFLFTLLAFVGVRNFSQMIQMVMISILIRLFAGIVEIPFLYIMRLIHNSNFLKEVRISE